MFLPALGQAFLAAFIYVVPAVSLTFLVSGMRDGRREAWDVPDDALVWKRGYHKWSGHALLLLRGLHALFAVHALMVVTLKSEGSCAATQVSHLSAAAANGAQWTDVAFLVGFAAWAAFAMAGLIFALLYLFEARRRTWPDPRRRDIVVLHAVLVPLASLLLYAGFAAVVPLVCG